MKKTKLLSSLAAGALLSLTMVTASALPFLLQSSAGLINLKINTPGGKEVYVDNYIADIGNVKNGVCNITKTFNLKKDFPAMRFKISQSTFHIISSTLVSILGTGYGCVNNIIIYNGKNYQTGFIYLTWDQIKGEYTHAHPSNITIDISK